MFVRKKTPSRDRMRRKKRDQRDRRDLKRTAAARLTDIYAYAERERESKKISLIFPARAFQIQKDQKKFHSRRERTNLLHHRRNLRASLERGLSRGSSGRWRFRHRERLESNRRHFFVFRVCVCEIYDASLPLRRFAFFSESSFFSRRRFTHKKNARADRREKRGQHSKQRVYKKKKNSKNR